MTKRIVMNLLSDRPIAYHPDIARVAGGVKAGIFLSQLLYWSDKGKRTDGYIWKTQGEWETETALTRREQESARKILKSKGLLDEKLQGIPAKLYYKINTDILYQLLDDLYVQSSMHESAILDVTEAPNSDAPKRQSITESTKEYTETTSTVDSLFSETFPNHSVTDKDLYLDDLDHFGESKMMEALNIVKAEIMKGKKIYSYNYLVSVLNRKEKVTSQKSNIEKIYNQIRRANADRKLSELPPDIVNAIRKLGGRSRFISLSGDFEVAQYKRELAKYVQ